MKQLFLLAGLFSLMLWGNSIWSHGNEISDKPTAPSLADTLIYKYHTAKERSPDCGKRPDSECTVAKVKYPVFKDQPILNDSIQRKLAATFNFGDHKISTVKELVHGVIKAYLADTDLIRSRGSYLLRASLKVMHQDPLLLIFEMDGHTYAGGAHGLDETAFLNWDVKKQKEITLNDILIIGYTKQLTATGEKIFRKDEKLSERASLADNYFFDKGKFSLNNNFMITPTGLLFLYNEYEIKSFAAGQTKLFIPYNQIKSLLRPNTVVSQYIK